MKYEFVVTQELHWQLFGFEQINFIYERFEDEGRVEGPSVGRGALAVWSVSHSQSVLNTENMELLLLPLLLLLIFIISLSLSFFLPLLLLLPLNFF